MDWSRERRHHGGGMPDRTPGLQVSGEDWEEHSKLRNSVSIDTLDGGGWGGGGGDGECKGLMRDEAGMLGRD